MGISSGLLIFLCLVLFISIIYNIFLTMKSKMAIDWPTLLSVSLFVLLTATTVTNSQLCSRNGLHPDEQALCAYLVAKEGDFSDHCKNLKEAEWRYTTNVSPETMDAYDEAYEIFRDFSYGIQSDAITNFNGSYPNFGTRKAVGSLKRMGRNTMAVPIYEQMIELEITLRKKYDAIKVCSRGEVGCVEISLNEMRRRIKISTDVTEREYYFVEWNKKVSEAVTPGDYETLVQLHNEYARANGFAHMGEMLLEPYNDGSQNWKAETFLNQMIGEWGTMRPSFERSRKFATDRLKPEFASKIDVDNNIDITVLNDLWGEDWSSLAERTKPFPLTRMLDDYVTDAMRQKNKNANAMFVDANRLMVSIGLQDLLVPDYGWKGHSIINETEIGNDKEMICEPQAVDMCEDFKFRIRMCTEPTMKDFVTVNEELGKAQYFFGYKDLLYMFRTGANPAMPLAVAKALGLAAQSPEYLNCNLKYYLGPSLEFCDLSGPTTTTTSTTTTSTTTTTTTTTTTPSPPTTQEATTQETTTEETTTEETTTEETTTEETTTEETTTQETTTQQSTTEESTTEEDTSGSPSPLEFDEHDLYNFEDSENTDVKIAEKLERTIGKRWTRAVPPTIQNTEANYLYKLQLQYLDAAYALAIEHWRWLVYNGTITRANYNSRWWDLRKQYQGLKTHVSRADPLLMDAASKFDVISNRPYIDEFVSHIVQFQIFENLCTVAGQYDKNSPDKKILHRCMLSEGVPNTKAFDIVGDMIKEMMQSGSEVSWTEVLKNVTGSEEISTGPMLEFVEPVAETIEEVLNPSNPSKKSSTGAIIAGVIAGVAVIAVVAGYLVGKKVSSSINNDNDP